MNIPKKITPDCIDDAIIRIEFKSDHPAEVLIGVLYDRTTDEYEYRRNMRNTESGGLEGMPSFDNGKIRCHVAADSILFVTLTHYPGWIAYIAEVKKILEQVYDARYFPLFTKVGIRVVSRFPNQLVTNVVHFEYKSRLNAESPFFDFKTIYVDDGYHVSLRLMDKIKAVSNRNLTDFPTKEVSDEISSVVDVEVQRSISTADVGSMYEALEAVHLKEKQTFFSVLREDFLQTLNPEY